MNIEKSVETFLLVAVIMEAENERDPAVIAKHIATYEKQLLDCKTKGLIPALGNYDAGLYFLKARREASIAALGNTTDTQARDHLNRAVTLLSEAIELEDNLGYRLFRARLNNILKNKKTALQDVEYILENSSDSEICSEARKLKQEIKASESKCFVATAAYGSPLAPEVVVFRQFRDVRLRQNWLGCWAISVYEHVSPPFANWITTRPRARHWIQKYALTPALWFVRKFM